MHDKTRRAVEEDLNSLTLVELLRESDLWVELLLSDPPAGWTREILEDQRSSLDEIRTQLAQADISAEVTASLAERLAGYCTLQRLRHDGRPPTA